tara:strand:+ start:275 stop:1795 length:1521 start_codon:yes stop_codon:yes gene_type:complete
MKKRKLKLKQITTTALLAIAAVSVCGNCAAAGKRIKTDKLQIVFMLGQSEMVGKAELSSAAYMLEKPLVPPRDITLNAHKAMLHQPNGAYLYWVAMHSYGGPAEKKEELKKLLVERAAFKAKFKQHVLDELEKNDGMFRGKKYAKRGKGYGGFWLFNMGDDECEKVGLTPKIRAVLEAPDNKFNVEAAYDQLMADAKMRYQKQLELNQLYLKGATPADFTAYAKAVKKYQAAPKNVTPGKKRRDIAALAKTHLHLPVAKRTYITGLGTISGTPEGDSGNVASGKLSVGYGANERSIGLEYTAGMALEQNIDAPILIIKCAWDSRQNLSDFWQQQAKESTLAHIKKVLADPGKYHPDYDPKAGFEPAGLILFQGTNDKNNPNYAAQLASLLNDVRKTVKNPKLPVVCATVGGMYFKGESDDQAANSGMQAVAQMPGFKGTVDVMDTYLWRPSELALLRSMARKRRLKPDAAMQETLRNAGNGSFYLLAGQEAGLRLAQLTAQARKTK